MPFVVGLRSLDHMIVYPEAFLHRIKLSEGRKISVGKANPLIFALKKLEPRGEPSCFIT